MASTVDLWDDEPLSVSAQIYVSGAPDADEDVATAPRPSRPRSSALFLQSDSEDDAPPSARAASKPASERPDIDALFDDLDDQQDSAFQDIAPSLDLDALRRQADAANAKTHPLTPHEILPRSSPSKEQDDNKGGKGEKDGVKERKRIPKLDEARLLSPDGFPALIQQVKGFKPKGKGHETSDLNRVMQVYQFWSHKLYPRMQFRDTTQRVERLCHSRRMHAALRTWHDEAKGIRPQGQPIDLTSDGEKDSSSDDEDASTPRHNADQGAVSRQSSQPASAQPSAAAKPASDSYLDDDFDMDAAIREDEERRIVAAAAATAKSVASPSLPAPSAIEVDDEEAMWEELGVFPDERPQPPRSSSPPLAPDDMPEDMGEDMWDAVREAEEAVARGQQAPAAACQVAEPSAANMPAGATNEEGWDEMYA